MKKVDLVLSGGGARGFAHVGVLEVLEKEGIPISRIAGTSAGALIAVLYASCLDAQKVRHFIQNLVLYKLPDFSFSRLGLVKGDKVEKIVGEFIGVKNFEELKIPVVVNATDIATGKEVVFSKGNILTALGATIAYPGVITPKKWRKHLLIDGGVVNPLPMDLLPGKNPMILVDTSSDTTLFEKKHSVIGMLKQSVNILQLTLIKEKLKKINRPYVYITPNLKEWEIFELKNDPKIIDRGARATRQHIARIKNMLS